MNFYTSDLHLGHANIIKYENRPFSNVTEMDDYLIEKWNKKVRQNDSVYILGDFAFCDGQTAVKYISRLNGLKYLIKGNHDSFLHDKSFSSNFGWVRDYAKINDDGYKVILFHYPIAVWDCQHHGSIHLYGHIHSNKDNHHPLTVNLVNAFNVGVDINDFEPKTLKELIGTSYQEKYYNIR